MLLCMRASPGNAICVALFSPIAAIRARLRAALSTNATDDSFPSVLCAVERTPSELNVDTMIDHIAHGQCMVEAKCSITNQRKAKISVS